MGRLSTPDPGDGEASRCRPFGDPCTPGGPRGEVFAGPSNAAGAWPRSANAICYIGGVTVPAHDDGYLNPLDRDRFLAARGWLRRLLASQLLCAPGQVRMVTRDGAKPGLASSDLRCNAARSAGLALYATSWSWKSASN